MYMFTRIQHYTRIPWIVRLSCRKNAY